MTRIYLTRHGETEWNRQKRFQGSKNSELTEKGILAAELLASRVEEIDLDCIISSPLKRAYQTAEIVRGNKGIDIVKCDGFKEINLGDFEGMRWDEIEDLHGDVLNKITDDPFDNRYPNGENLMEFYNRVENSLREIIEKFRDKSVLIVAHGGTINCILSYFRGVKINKNWMGHVAENCSLSCFEVNKAGVREIFFNDTEHLRGITAYN
jgi:probable phosphoglycerate mutase